MGDASLSEEVGDRELPRRRPENRGDGGGQAAPAAGERWAGRPQTGVPGYDDRNVACPDRERMPNFLPPPFSP